MIPHYLNTALRLTASLRACMFCAALMASTEYTAHAWSSNPNINNPICTIAGAKFSPEIASDGAGGHIITWSGQQAGGYHIFAQRIDAQGNLQWTASGVPVCTASGTQSTAQIVSDNAGGAIVTWYDTRAGNTDIYAQRINATGSAQWAVDGIPICIAANNQLLCEITSDTAGGAIITWYDQRSGDYDIYAQRVDISGTVQWTPDGAPIAVAANDQMDPQLIGDGFGGALITWYDGRSGDKDVYAQRINASGAVQWTPNGVAVCTAVNDQTQPELASDGANGAIITWTDLRSGTEDIYARRINSSGVLQWSANGEPVSVATNVQFFPQITSNGTGGAIITWQDARSDVSDVYAQRIDSIGSPQWTANGISVSTALNYQRNPEIIADGAGGAIITWFDSRAGSGNYDAYAQRINSAGTAIWAANGAAISTAAMDQTSPQLISDGSGGAVITWYDFRSGFTDFHIYAAHISAGGILPVTLSHFSVI